MVEFRDHMTVQYVDHMGSDESILRAMLASTAKAHEVDGYTEEQKFGKINFLMKNRHGTPFEHAAMTFYMEMPIFVFREFHRHRIGWSYNEMSGRYVELPPTFYMPSPSRPLVQEGKPGHYKFVPGDEIMYGNLQLHMKSVCETAYEAYSEMMREGVAKEVARMVLPVNIFSAQYATANPRSIMAFLSLRTEREAFWQVPDDVRFLGLERAWTKNHDGAMFPSKPMKEIQMVADDIEAMFADQFPLTCRAWRENGRVAP